MTCSFSNLSIFTKHNQVEAARWGWAGLGFNWLWRLIGRKLSPSDKAQQRTSPFRTTGTGFTIIREVCSSTRIEVVLNFLPAKRRLLVSSFHLFCPFHRTIFSVLCYSKLYISFTLPPTPAANIWKCSLSLFLFLTFCSLLKFIYWLNHLLHKFLAYI